MPPVIDSRDVLEDPRRALTALCAALDVPFSERMLSWPAGRRATDGAWAPHWYGSVEASTEFAPWRPRTGTLSAEHEALLARCRPFYDALCQHRIVP